MWGSRGSEPKKKAIKIRSVDFLGWPLVWGSRVLYVKGLSPVLLGEGRS